MKAPHNTPPLHAQGQHHSSPERAIFQQLPIGAIWPAILKSAPRAWRKTAVPKIQNGRKPPFPLNNHGDSVFFSLKISMKLHRAHIILVDISGYTQFIRLHRMSIIHAERIITELLESVIDASNAPLVLNKLEGDAALFYALAGEDESSAKQTAIEVLQQVQRFFSVFRSREQELVSECTICLCDACDKAGDLKLKVIAHAGEVLLKQVRQFEEIAGEDVILAHRLLKNSLATDEYLLLTDAFLALSGIPEGLRLTTLTEECGGHGKVTIHVHLPSSTSTLPSPPHANLWRKIKTTLRLESHLIKRLLGAPGAKFHHLPVIRGGDDHPTL